MPLDSVIMDSITCKEKRKYHLKFQGSGPAQLKFQGSGPAQMKEHVLIIIYTCKYQILRDKPFRYLAKTRCSFCDQSYSMFLSNRRVMNS